MELIKSKERKCSKRKIFVNIIAITYYLLKYFSKWKYSQQQKLWWLNWCGWAGWVFRLLKQSGKKFYAISLMRYSSSLHCTYILFWRLTSLPVQKKSKGSLNPLQLSKLLFPRNHLPWESLWAISFTIYWAFQILRNITWKL